MRQGHRDRPGTRAELRTRTKVWALAHRVGVREGKISPTMSVSAPVKPMNIGIAGALASELDAVQDVVGLRSGR